MANWTPPLYPRMHLLPSGNVFYSGSASPSRLFNPTTKAWTTVANTNLSTVRTYGSSVLLPLTPANNYRPKVMLLGGGVPTATATTEIIDLGANSPAWQSGPDMSQARVEMDAVLLPTGKILALAGSSTDEDASTASLNADLYDPDMNSFSSPARIPIPVCITRCHCSCPMRQYGWLGAIPPQASTSSTWRSTSRRTCSHGTGTTTWWRRRGRRSRVPRAPSIGTPSFQFPRRTRPILPRRS